MRIINNNSSVNLMVEGIVRWINTTGLKRLYIGVKADCAIALGIAPNNPRFHAAWDSQSWRILPSNYILKYMVAFYDE